MFIICIFSAKDREEITQGWDREPLPACFIELMEKYILRRAAKGAFRSLGESPGSRRKTWQRQMNQKLGNSREKLFYFLARNDKTVDAMVTTRYKERVKWFNNHYVSPLKTRKRLIDVNDVIIEIIASFNFLMNYLLTLLT